MHAVIEADVANCLQQIRKHRYDQFWRRTIVRTFGAGIEAETHVFAEILRGYAETNPLNLNREQEQCLQNEKSCSALNAEVRMLERVRAIERAMIHRSAVATG